MALQCPHGILQNEWVVAISWQEISDSGNWVDRGPIEQVLLVSLRYRGIGSVCKPLIEKRHHLVNSPKVGPQ